MLHNKQAVFLLSHEPFQRKYPLFYFYKGLPTPSSFMLAFFPTYHIHEYLPTEARYIRLCERFSTMTLIVAILFRCDGSYGEGFVCCRSALLHHDFYERWIMAK